MTLNELARRTGLPVTTLRNYEKIGVFSRSGGGRYDAPDYDSHAERRVHFLSHARTLGFDLAFSRLMLDFMTGADVAADEREATVEVFMHQVRQRIELLTAFETFLSVAGSAPATDGADPLVGIESLVDRRRNLSLPPWRTSANIRGWRCADGGLPAKTAQSPWE